MSQTVLPMNSLDFHQYLAVSNLCSLVDVSEEVNARVCCRGRGNFAFTGSGHHSLGCIFPVIRLLTRSLSLLHGFQPQITPLLFFKHCARSFLMHYIDNINYE